MVMTTTPTPTKIHTHPLTSPHGPAIVRNALTVLRPYLPVSIAVYRRLQFGRFFEDSVVLTNLPFLEGSHGDGGGGEAGIGEGEEWIVAFVDRTCRPETEVWWFGSWEGRDGDAVRMEVGPVEMLLTDLFRTVKGLRVPESLHQDVLDAAAAAKQRDEDKQASQQGRDGDEVKDISGVSRADYSAHLLNADIILCGAIHEKSVPALKKTGLIKNMFQGPEHTQMVPNHTFVFDVDGPKVVSVAERKEDLPDGLRWGELKYEHFKTVRARTQIPRQDKTLAVLPNLAIYEGDVPIAWTFVGLDGSLTTLHVEEQWRGKGLAKAIAAKLFREKMDFLWEEGVKKMAFGFVVNGNDESVHLCRSLGGVSDWETYWIRVDLGALR